MGARPIRCTWWSCGHCRAGATHCLDQIGERFGALPADAAERIQRAGLDDLERWTRRVVRAQTLADVLAA